MDINVIGTGYVGLVAGACLAALGHCVACSDIDTAKIASLKRSIITLHEPGLKELVHEGTRAGRLHFTSDVAGAIEASSMVFIAVGTPSNDDGSADTRAVFDVAAVIASAAQEPKTVVIKSTVPVGTAQAVSAFIAERSSVAVAVLSNPEFLREAHGVEDFQLPPRVVIGAGRCGDEAPLYSLYQAFVPDDRILVMDTRSAELSKYASNAFLATRISFINEMANLCEIVGADIDQLRRTVELDPRLGSGYLSPGVGYGGSCLPKDVEAIVHLGRGSRTPVRLLEAVQETNTAQPQRLIQKIQDYFAGALEGRRIAVWGLAFKPDTDDMRAASSLVIIDLLLKGGAQVVAYDPLVGRQAISSLNGKVAYVEAQYDCLNGAEALVVATEWEQFRFPDWGRMRSAMKTCAVFDGRNVYDARCVVDEGFAYFGVGRGSQLPSGIGNVGGRSAAITVSR